ncbi:N-acetylmuramoyl-L-alanine amidase [bacterium]|nr:MAG: N-acetylmuramoyl-L-alanine amidase [bacterium]
MSLAALFLALSLPAAAETPVVALDPGHGGFDMGQSLNGVREREFALAFARLLEPRLKARGTMPFLTRFSDEFVALSSRVVSAEQVHSKVFLSIHLDNNAERGGKGVMLWVYGKNNSIPQGPPRQHGERMLPAPPKDQVAVSRRLAERIQIVLRKRGLRVAGYVDRGPFAVLKGPGMASVLIEVANLHDKAEARQVKDPAFQAKLADAVADAVGLHLASEARRGP